MGGLHTFTSLQSSLQLKGPSITHSVLCEYMGSLSPRLPEGINPYFNSDINLNSGEWRNKVCRRAYEEFGLTYEATDQVDNLRGVPYLRELHRTVNSRPATKEITAAVERWHLTPKRLTKYKRYRAFLRDY